MSIIRAEVSGYRHIGYYDSEFVIKGILHIDTRQYNFLHYDGAFGFSRLEIKAGKLKASYDEAEGFQMQQGKEAPEGGLLNVNRKDAIKQIQEAATSYLTTDLNAWAEYFNLATRSAGPFADAPADGGQPSYRPLVSDPDKRCRGAVSLSRPSRP